MPKKTLADLTDLAGKRVLVRVDFNVPQDEHGRVTNDRRIRAALPTLRTLLDAGAAVIVMSHLGRPKGDPQKDARFSLAPVAERLGRLLDQPVAMAPAVVGPEVAARARALRPGELLVLENLRFHRGEQEGDAAFAAELAALADVYVNDAFGTCHRSDASMVAVPRAMKGKPRVVGRLVERELHILDRLLADPAHPFVGILGGAKVSDKIAFINSLLQRVDRLLIGGAMSYTFLKAQGQGVGNSRVEADKLDVARELLQRGQGKIVLPVDHIVVDRLDAPQTARIVAGAIPEGTVGVDIGPQTATAYLAEIRTARMVVWNGPMGKFEDQPFSAGTRSIAEGLALASGVTVVGGGETAEAVEDFGLADRITHVSTGGGAFLAYVEGTPFPALDEIDSKSA
jgi:phosphoglycerate kinase